MTGVNRNSRLETGLVPISAGPTVVHQLRAVVCRHGDGARPPLAPLAGRPLPGANYPVYLHHLTLGTIDARTGNATALCVCSSHNLDALARDRQIARGWSLWKLPANSNVRMGCSESYVRQGRLSGTLTSKLPVLLAGSAQNFFLQLSGLSGETSSPGKSRASTQRNGLLGLRNQDVAQTRTWLGQETRRVPSIAAPTRDLARLPVPPSVTSSRAAIVATDKPVISPEGHAGHFAGRLHCKLQLLRQHATEVASGVLAGCKPMLGLRCDGAGCMQACAQLRTRRLRLRYTHNTQPM